MLKQNHTLYLILQVFTFALLSACSSSPLQEDAKEKPAQVKILIPHANELDAITTLINSNETIAAQQAINLLQTQKLNRDEILLLSAAQAEVFNLQEKYEQALKSLSSRHIEMQLPVAQSSTQISVQSVKAQTLSLLNKHQESAELRIFIAPIIVDQSRYLQNHFSIWKSISQLPEDELNPSTHKIQNSDLTQWLTLAKIMRFNNGSLDQQMQDIALWQHQNALHPAALIPPQDIADIRTAVTQRPKKIAIILPFDGKYQSYANAISDGLMHAYYQSDFQPLISFYSVDDQQSFLDTYTSAVAEGANLIIGPLLKSQLEELYTLKTLPVTTIALNTLPTENKPENLIEFSLSSEDDIDTIINLLKTRKQKKALIFSQDVSWATDDANYFTTQWQAEGFEVLNHRRFKANKDQSSEIQQLLNIDKSRYRIRQMNRTLGQKIEAEPRRRQDADFVYVLAKPNKASSIRPILKFHYADDLDVYASASIYQGIPDPLRDRDMNGITFTALPWIIEPPSDINDKYKKSPLLRMYAFGFDALLLSERMVYMQNNSHAQFRGATGTLLFTDNELQRHARIAQFKRSKVQHVSIRKIDENTQ